MGSGKSHVGQLLAQRLQKDFWDLDKIIVAQSGKSIKAIFAEKNGEMHFRQLEAEILRQTYFFKSAIIALGGGTPCFFNNMLWLKQHGQTIYLQASPKILAQRLMPEKSDRPLISHITSIQKLTTFIEQKLAERVVFYQQAQYTQNTDNLIPPEIAEQLTILLK